MNKRETLKNLKKKKILTKVERNLYFISSILFLSTIIINIMNIFYYPYLINGLILEINICIIIICFYLTIKKQQKLLILEDETLELKINYILNKS